jgi:DNA polymerase-1
MSSEKALLLIDGDLLLHRSSTRVEFEGDYGNDTWILSSNVEEAREVFTSALNHFLYALGSDDYVICLSDPEFNFRKELFDGYKSKRKDVRKPLAFRPLREWVVNNHRTVWRPKLEADDCLGIIATNPEQRRSCIIVSEDKDLRTIPCWLFREGRLEKVTEEDANRYWLTQALTGDPTDGYSGCPGVGAVKAEKILGLKPDYGLVEVAYLKAGLTREDALLNARLARILRHENWNKEKQEVILWEPRAITSPPS